MQGLVLWILNHDAVLEGLEDNLLQIQVDKYVDDITLIEAIPKNCPVEEDLTSARVRHTFNPLESQIVLKTIATRAESKKCK